MRPKIKGMVIVQYFKDRYRSDSCYMYVPGIIIYLLFLAGCNPVKLAEVNKTIQFKLGETVTLNNTNISILYESNGKELRRSDGEEDYYADIRLKTIQQEQRVFVYYGKPEHINVVTEEGKYRLTFQYNASIGCSLHIARTL